MATADTNTLATTMPAPTFSYAQAAKGAAVASAPPNPPPVTTPGATSQNGASDIDASKTITLRTLSLSKGERSDATSGENSNNQDNKTELTTRAAVEATTASEKLSLRSSAPASTNGSGRGDEDANADQPTQRSERRPRSPSIASTNPQDTDSKNERKERKDRSADSEPRSREGILDTEQPRELVKIELVEAPIPAINPWQQRKEAQVAKARHTSIPVLGGQSPTDVESPVGEEASSQLQDAVKQTPRPGDSYGSDNGPNGHQTVGKSQKKSGPEGFRDSDATTVRRNGGPRGGRTEKEDKSLAAPSLPPVQDSTAWPTPDSTTKEERRQSLERNDNLEKDNQEPASSARKKGKAHWEKVDIPLTYKFDTAISHPSSRGRGRGGARGGRDGLSRGAHMSNASAHVEKRPANGPTPGSSSGAESSTQKVNGDTRDRRESTTSGRPQTVTLPVKKQTAGDVSGPQDRRKHSGPTASVNGERARDATFVPVQDPPLSGRERPEGKAERGRSGLRGRGGHQPPQIQTQALNWAQHNGSYGSRPSQQPYSPPTRHPYGPQYSRPGGRGTTRSQQQQQTPSSFSQSRLPASNGTPASSLAQPSYQFDALYGMSPASASMSYPAPGYTDSFLLNMIRSQVEYWLSVNNLLKDTWLRKNMDSQGFVLLSVIANFRRMQTIARDTNLIRMACAESQTLDLVVGDDGHDRVRPRDSWQKWVLPHSEREDSARNDGPARLYFQSRHHGMAPQYPIDAMAAPYMTMSPGYFTPHGMTQGYLAFANEGVPHVNGHANGGEYVPETQLSAAVPAFSPRGTAEGFGNFEAIPAYNNGIAMDQSFSPNGVNGHFVSNGLGIASPSSPHGANGLSHDSHPSHATLNGVNGGHDSSDAFASQVTNGLLG